MAVNIGSKDLEQCKKGSSDIVGIYKGSTLIWPTKYDTVKSVADQICVDVGYEPIHYALFDGDTSNEGIRFGDMLWGTSQPFASISGASTFTQGLEGKARKALLCSNTNITLHSDARYRMTNAGTISICCKQTSSNSSNTGLYGGCIFGNSHWGLGYALGWRPNVDNNGPNFEIYTGTGNNDGAATRTPGTKAISINKWHHILCCFSISGGTAYTHIWIDGVYVSASSTGNNSVIGYQSIMDQGRTESIHLGRVLQSGWNYFKGAIQDFIMWPIVLPNAQLNALINYYKSHGVSN